ncbi:GLUG motif-containing protein [Parabacteroides timonensis]|uniref:GLUG motif-containing protein n=1 Tax=Parabacteroides timonensis TaxID=1871013 RepID=UPI00094E9050|nr:GLUG motif-containing protein [Parabacteroides timonensis]
MKYYLQKRIFRLLLAAVIVCLLPLAAWGQGVQPSGGGASVSDPYQISSRAHLEWIAEQVAGSNDFDGKYFKLQNEIYLSDSPWTPIGKPYHNSFCGTFDGDGYKITGLYIPATSPVVYGYLGLFGNIGANGHIKNLGVEIAPGGIELYPVDYTCEAADLLAGGIAAYTNDCTIEDCYVTGGGFYCNKDSEGYSIIMGGIVGEANGSTTIKNCYATIDLTFECENFKYYQANNRSGLSGIAKGGTITNCYYSGKLRAHVGTNTNYNWSVGGISSDGATINNCLVLSPDISAIVDNGTGTVRAYTISSNPTGSSNYVSQYTTLNGTEPIYDDGANGTKWTDIGDGDAPLSAWIGTSNWVANTYDKYMTVLKMTDGNTFKEDPSNVFKEVIPIKTAAELAAISANATSLAKDYRLANDIDLTEYITNNGGSWKSIGNNTTPFKGTFNGDGYRITGLTIPEGSSNTGDEGGLFGKIGTYNSPDYIKPEIVIKNLGVVIAESGIHINHNIQRGGGIASSIYSSKIQNCYVTGGSVIAVGNPNSRGTLSIGGIAGQIYATIEHCYSTIDLKADWDNPRDGNPGEDLYVGGIVGEASNGIIKNCFATGTISVSLSNVSDVGFNSYAGGIAAFNTGHSCTIENCLSVNSGGLSIETAIPASASINNIIGIKGTGNFTGNYTLSDIPKTAGVTSDQGDAGTDWDGVVAYPAGIFDNGEWQKPVTSISASTFPKLCYAGTTRLMPNQPDVRHPYRVNVSSVSNGTLTTNRQPWGKVGETITITTTPDGDYVTNGSPTVTGTSGTIAVSGSGNSYTFTMPAENVTVSATFIKVYTITVDGSIANGSIEVKKPDGTLLSSGANADIANGTVLSITATPDGGYRLKQLTVDGSPITGSTHTVMADATLSAEFELTPVTPPVDPDPTPPAPTVYYTVTLPSVEGAATDPVAGEYEVEAWGNFRFYLTLDKEYDQSEPVITTDRGETITPRNSDGAYIIKYVRNDVGIFIDNVVKNPDPVANETIATDDIKVWAAKGYLHISNPTAQKAQVYNLTGSLVKQADIPAGDTEWQLPAGIYIIRVGAVRQTVIL